VLGPTLLMWLLYHWGSGSHTDRYEDDPMMDVPAIEQAQGTHRALFAWFSSPRVAVRTAVRLGETVPGARVCIRPSEDHGAEGPVVALSAEIPSAWSTMVTRLLSGLGVAVLWDAGDLVDERMEEPAR
jgi:hypothetical protein